MGIQQLPINGITAVLRYKDRFVFEVSKPKYWTKDNDGNTLIGIKCIGGAPEGQESLMEALERELREEISIKAELTSGLSPFFINMNMSVIDPAPSSYFFPDAYFTWEYRRLSEHGVICTYIGDIRDVPKPNDVFGLVLCHPDDLMKHVIRQTPLEECDELEFWYTQKILVPLKAKISVLGEVRRLAVLYSSYPHLYRRIYFQCEK
jgi:8-oxo-dGTP pyrophosphatase MutT (NUDIX family)